VGRAHALLETLFVIVVTETIGKIAIVVLVTEMASIMVRVEVAAIVMMIHIGKMPFVVAVHRFLYLWLYLISNPAHGSGPNGACSCSYKPC
jgi:hypothetical protein